MKVPAFYNHDMPQATQAEKPRKVLHTVENDRTAGFMPAWVEATERSRTIEDVIAASLNDIEPGGTENALPYNDTGAVTGPQAEEEFGFGDLLDMINPLQQLPVIGHLYREFTGDTIRPISQIVGGALFGGPLGAAGGIINAIVEEETGKDVGSNAFAMMLQGDMPELKPSATNETPQERLSHVVTASAETPKQNSAYGDDMVGQLLALTNLKSDETIQIFRQTDHEHSTKA